MSNEMLIEINRLIADRDNGNESAQVEIDLLVVEIETKAEAVPASESHDFDLMMARFC